MQSLATFFEDNKPLAYAAMVAAAVVLIIVAFVLYRLIFGRPLRTSTGGRNRQPRLGIVDAYDLDRQRQLVLVRRDNVEHLIMIGGPSDVVIETSIVRSQGAALPRDKDGGPLIGAVTPPPAVASPPPQGALGPASQTVALPPIARAEPTLATRTEPSVAQRMEPAPQPGRTEPALGPAVPMPSPNVERAPVERSPQRPIATPDPAAPAGPSSQGDAVPPPRNLPPRSPSLPGRGPAQQQPAHGRTVASRPRAQRRPGRRPPGSRSPGSIPQGLGTQSPGPRDANGQGSSVQGPAGLGGEPTGQSTPDRAPTAPRPALPPRPPVQRPPLPPRPSLSSALPPRPPRPLPPRVDGPRPAPDRVEPARPDLNRPETTRAEPTRVEASREEPVIAPSRIEAATAAPDGQTSRAAEAPPRAEPRPATAGAQKSLETLESLEEEMAKLLGRPTPRRDG